MTNIHLLDELTANQIAAGEVIERPVSVVKELVENSLDAGAGKIVVEIRQGGLSLLKVTDNGCGISPENLSLAVKRHATSKISTITDLNELQTLGFRGEALASIISVAKVEILTREAQADSGVKLTVAGDKEMEIEPIGTQVGTTIVVADLFFNTPARKKFLRSEGYESGLIHEVLTKFSLSHPQVSFRLTRDGKEILNTAGINTHPDLLEHYYGHEVKEALVKVSGELPGGRIFGYVTLPTYHRRNRKGINFFINQRRIYSKELLQALENAYEDTLPKGQFPLGVLHLQLDPATIDVNVHPSKLEVRLRNPLLANEMSFLLKNLLIKNKKIPQYFLETVPIIPEAVSEAKLKEPIEVKTKDTEPRDIESKDIEPSDTEFKDTVSRDIEYGKTTSVEMKLACTEKKLRDVKPVQGVFKEFYSGSSPQKTEEASSLKSLVDAEQESQLDSVWKVKVIGQLAQTFILAESEEGLYLIDQHIAHERVIYERLLEKAATGTIESQVLLQPVTLPLSFLEEEAVLKYILPLVDLGIILEHFGPRSYLLRAIPSGIGEEPQDYFYSLLEHLESSKGKTEVSDLKKEFLIHSSCKMAIKANTRLTFQEMEQLLTDLSKTKNYLTCPHGRPIIYKITYQEILKAFHRG